MLHVGIGGPPAPCPIRWPPTRSKARRSLAWGTRHASMRNDPRTSPFLWRPSFSGTGAHIGPTRRSAPRRPSWPWPNGEWHAMSPARSHRVALAQVAVTAAEENRSVVDRLIEYLRVRVAQGVSPEAELIRAEVERGQTATDVTLAEIDLLRARAELQPYLSRACAAVECVAGARGGAVCCEPAAAGDRSIRPACVRASRIGQRAGQGRRDSGRSRRRAAPRGSRGRSEFWRQADGRPQFDDRRHQPVRADL